MGYLDLKMKVKDSIQFGANVYSYQIKERLLFTVVFFYFGCNYLVCNC